MFDISGSFNVLSSSLLALFHTLYLTGTNQQSVSVFCGTIRFVLSIPLLPLHLHPLFHHPPSPSPPLSSFTILFGTFIFRSNRNRIAFREIYYVRMYS